MVLNYASLKTSVGSNHGSLPERVASEIRVAIRDGRMQPGMRLVEARLALDLGVSRIPVREAIRRLAAEGLVTINARRGAVIAGTSEREIREMIEVRALLEGHNARLAARRRDPAVLRRIKLLLQRGEKAVAREKVSDLLVLNIRYHDETVAASANALLQEMLERLRERTAILFAPEEPGRQASLWNEHADILRAIVEGDEARAAELAAGHVRSAYPHVDSRVDPVATAPKGRSGEANTRALKP